MPSEKPRILILEDDDGHARLLREELLAEWPQGVDLDCSPRLAPALEAARRKRFDAILLDLSLPDADGLEALKEMRAVARDTPILVVTGRSDEGLGMSAALLGAHGFLLKDRILTGAVGRAVRFSIERDELFRADGTEMLRLLVENHPDGMVFLDPEGRIRMINPAATRTLGHPATELLGRPPAEFLGALPPLPREAGALRTFPIRAPDAEAPLGEGRIQQVPWRGEPWYLMSLHAGAEGATPARPVGGAPGAALAQALAQAPLLLFRFDAEGRLTAADGGMRDVLGAPAGTGAGLSVADVGRENPPLCNDLGRALHGEHVEDVMDVGERVIGVHLRPIPSEEGGGVVGVAHDVTALARRIEGLERGAAEQRQALADLHEAHASIDAYARNVAHDLGDPIRMMDSFLELLQQRCGAALDADGRAFLGYAREGAAYARELATGLLRYAEIGTRPPAFRPVDLNATVTAVERVLANRLKECGGIVSHGPLPTVWGDPALLASVLQNLVGNGVKFHGLAPPRVRILAEPAGDEWTVTVEDNGLGIDPAQQGRIFQLFARLHPRAEYPGSGVGLALAKRIVEGHGGRLWVESEPARGSRFRFTVTDARARRPEVPVRAPRAGHRTLATDANLLGVAPMGGPPRGPHRRGETPRPAARQPL